MEFTLWNKLTLLRPEFSLKTGLYGFSNLTRLRMRDGALTETSLYSKKLWTEQQPFSVDSK